MRPAPLLAVLCALLAPTALAHRPSDAFLTLEVQGAQLRGQWEIALRDLDVATGLDADGDRALTWGELRGARPAIERLVADRLAVRADTGACTLRVSDLLVNDRVEGHYAWVALAGDCPATPEALALRYSFLFDVDPTHRGILVLHAGGIAHSAVFAPDRQELELRLGEASGARQFGDYLREGIHHIWIGADHVLFLLSLLLPCVLRREAGAWRGAVRLAPVLAEVVRVVTAFTLAHSVTLTLSALGVLRLPTALTEAAIALSVLLAALNNLRPVVTGGRWAMACVFGLVHGFGFASVLGELGLPDGARLLALLAFNLGVEVGQLAIVAAAVPLAFALRDTGFYRRGVFTAGSLAVAAIAAWWFAQRSGILGA